MTSDIPVGKTYPVFFGSAGVTIAMGMTALGSSIGFALCGVMVSAVGVDSPDLVMKSLVPIIMASVISIYGLVVALLVSSKINIHTVADSPLKCLAAGLCVGICGIAAGATIGVIGKYGVFTYSKQPKFFVGLILMLIFGEVLGIYGLITSLLLIL